MSFATALVAEEDPDLSALIAAALRTAGFTVLEASTHDRVEREMRRLAAHAHGSTLLLVVSGGSNLRRPRGDR